MIGSVAKLPIQNPWSDCGGNYCNIRYEYNVHEDVPGRHIGRVWQAGVTDERLSDASVLPDII